MEVVEWWEVVMMAQWHSRRSWKEERGDEALTMMQYDVIHSLACLPLRKLVKKYLMQEYRHSAKIE